MGIKDLHHWNKACSIKLIWLLFFRSGSIWVAWFSKTILQSCTSNFWIIKEKQSHSHTVKKLIRVRDLAYPWIKVKVGNGRTTRFWVDNWSPFGNLRTFLNLSQSSTLGTRATATIDDLCREGIWSLPSPRSEQQLSLHAHLTTINLSEEEDTIFWMPQGKKLSTFSTGMIYDLLREHKPQVLWHKAVWTSRGIPKQNFLTWLVHLNRCPTKDRIVGWGLQTDPRCVLCNMVLETRDHLFFDCNFSFSTWSALATKARTPQIRQWNQVVNYMQSIQAAKHIRLLQLLAWQTAVYFIWIERNSRIHRGSFRSVDSITSVASSLIKNKISSLRNSSPQLSSSMIQIWLSD